MTHLRLAALAAGLSLAFAAPASAQLFGRPPADVPQQVAQGPDVAGMSVRVERLEGQIRSLTGQIEQLQNRNRVMEEQLKRFQQDVEFRFQEQGGGARKPAPTATPPTPAAPAPGRRSAVEPAPQLVAPQPQVAAAPVQPVAPATPTPPRIAPSVKVDPGTLGPFAGKPAAAAPATPSNPGAKTTKPGKGDAFDPAANPNAPGAPRQLGQTPPTASGARGDEIGSILDEGGANAPMDLANPRVIAAPEAARAQDPASRAQEAALQPADPARADYDYAMIAYRNGQYDTADALLRQFVQKHPGDRLVPDAIYNRGETLHQRGRHADAAEQYLKVTTDFGQSQRAPDAMLKLGMSLQAMGVKEQACATYSELSRKHPSATAAIKAAGREMKRAGC